MIQSPGGTTKSDQTSRVHTPIALRLGFHYVKGLHGEAGQAIVQERNGSPFTSIQDLARRVPELNKKELNTLAEMGALKLNRKFTQRYEA